MAYKEEFKISLVREYERGGVVAEIARKNGVSEGSVYRWIREYKMIQAGNATFTPKEFASLKKRSERQAHMIEIIRLSGFISAMPLKKRLPVMESIYKSHPDYSVHEICEAMEVARGTFYNHIFRRADTQLKDERELIIKQAVNQIFMDSSQRYGADRIMKVLGTTGIYVTKKHVLEIMDELGLESVRVGAKRISINKREQLTNRLKRDFSADAPNKAWVSDITHFSFQNQHFYICAIVDLYSRKILACRVAKHESKQLVSSTLLEALKARRPEPGLVFHSDRGSQYIANSFKKLLAQNGICQSLSEKGTPVDNAVCEAFFSTMKKEELYRRDYHSESDFKRSVFEYVNYYNGTRAHSYLNYRCPNDFEDLFYRKK